ncbi:oxygen-dependent tRNA uridine(34) hydroxylase TrhO [Halovulum sp. GXIMD14794]
MQTVAALYRFARFEDPAALAGPLRHVCAQGDVRGTLILAAEGINGTIAGREDGIRAAVAHIRTLPGCADLQPKYSTASEPPFGKLKVRLKSEIVTMGEPGIDPLGSVGTYVAPQDWNALISAPDVAVIDTRNDYEVGIGTFEGAVDPETRSFREFPEWWQQNAARFEGKRVAMFCTGGIRCEKATSYLKEQGVEQVYHLDGGILKYLEDVPADESLWRGACFVFDDRVSVTHGLEEGPHLMCHGCRRPLEPEDIERPEYERGVSCHRCMHEHSDADRARFRERQRQIDLLRAREVSDDTPRT